MYVGISDKVLNDWLKDKEYISVADEGEAIAVAVGHFIATGERATAFMSADGFCNALNPLTSWVIPYGLEINIVISTGRTEPAHCVMTDILDDLLDLIKNHEGFDPDRISFEVIRKE